MSPLPQTLLLVDALNLIRRVYAAQPGEDGPERARGARDSATQSLSRALREASPTHAVCVFDGGGESWRHELFPPYKAGHASMPRALAEALDDYRDAFRDLGVSSLAFPRLEADDVIATAATKAAAAGVVSVVLSTDRAFLQLLGSGVRVRDHFQRLDLDSSYATSKFGVRPDQLADSMALAGDHGNGIPGVPGVGPKSAAKLLARHESLDGVLEAAGAIEGKIGERLREHVDDVRLYRKLVGLETNLELGNNLSDLRYRPSRV